MAYLTGTANSLADLLAAIQNACTANGWTLSGSVLHKGTCYIEVKISGSIITIRGGTGIDGSNNLTGACDTGGGALGSPASGINIPSTPAFTFPVTYFAHVLTSPDEVYFVINYATNFYETMAFGQSAMPGLTGTGNWYFGVYGGNGGGYRYQSTGESFTTAFQKYAVYALLMSSQFGSLVGGVDHRLDSVTWKIEGAWRDWASPFFRQPNQWNQESILIPVRVYAARPSGFVSPVLECAHARYVSLANLQDQQIITLGTDKWKIYPWWSRGNAYNSSGSNGTYTGIGGHAIRYDGP